MGIMVFGIAALLALVINLVTGILIIIGALQMMRLKSYGGAMMASVLALLPCGPLILVGIPIGIWSLVVLNREKVKAAFGAGGDQTGSPPVPHTESGH